MSVTMYLSLKPSPSVILMFNTGGEEARTYGGMTCQGCAPAEETRYAMPKRKINERLILCYFHSPSRIGGHGVL